MLSQRVLLTRTTGNVTLVGGRGGCVFAGRGGEVGRGVFVTVAPISGVSLDADVGLAALVAVAAGVLVKSGTGVKVGRGVREGVGLALG